MLLTTKTKADYRRQARSALKDWHNQERLFANISNSAVALEFAGSRDSFCKAGDVFWIGGEALYISSKTTGTGNENKITVRRGWNGTTAVAHTTAEICHNGIAYSDLAIDETINEGIAKMFPSFYTQYRMTIDGGEVHEYILTNNDPLIPDPSYSDNVCAISVIQSTLAYDNPLEVKNARLEDRADGVHLILPGHLTGFTILVDYITSIPKLVDDTDTPLISEIADHLPIFWCQYRLIADREPARVTQNAYQNNILENSVAPGVQFNISKFYRERFYDELGDLAVRMPTPRKYTRWVR